MPEKGGGVRCETLPRNVIRLYAGPIGLDTLYRVGVRLRKLIRSFELYTYIRPLFAQQR